ncbi:MAG: glutamate racemase [Xanthobacteraceae bacterium]
MPRILPTILVFDSGLGGLTVFREVVKARPDARYVYVADDAFFPYGRHEEPALIARLVPLMGELIATYRPDLVVIACNTASTLALADLRAAYSVPFVGTVPAIKPACAASKTRLVSVLGTEATVAREYTRKLIADFGQGCAVTLVGSAGLASLAEAALRAEPVDDDAILEEIAPCFIERDGRRTDAVVLACTHYPLLSAHLTRLSPWPVAWIDPAPAIARRVVQLLGPPGLSGADPNDAAEVLAPDRVAFTSAIAPPPAVIRALIGFGLRLVDEAPAPLAQRASHRPAF